MFADCTTLQHNTRSTEMRVPCLLSLIPAAVSLSVRSEPHAHSLLRFSRSLRSLSSLSFQFQENNRQALVEWPSCTEAQYYRVNSLSVDERNNNMFKTISTIEPKTLLKSLRLDQAYQVTVTPMTANGEEISDQRLSKTIRSKVRLLL
jgi:hypothetical protein